MKKIFNKLMPLGLIMLAFVACKKDEVQTTVKANADASALTASTNNVVLEKSMLATDVVTFNLTNADFGYDAAVSNVLQIGLKGTDFTGAKEAILPAKALSKAFNGLDFNNLLLSLNLPTTASSDVEVRIKSTVSPDVPPVYSNVVSMKAKPFPLTAWIYIPGNYQGWKPETADSLVSLTGNGIYVGTIALNGEEFKITPAKKWDVAYGDAGGGTISATAAGNLKPATSDVQELTVDLNVKTIVMESVVWSVVGNGTASDWPPASGPYNELDMQFMNGKWTRTLTLLNGEIKFRKNHAWATSFGGNGSGTLTGDNIAVTAGTYTITLDIPNNKYSLVKN